MSIEPWLTQTLWRAQDNLARQGSLGELESSGTIAADNKSFNWDVSSRLIDQIKDCCQLYRIDVTASWKVYAKHFSLTKSAYVLHKE
jgi:hypothetical protein